MTKRVIQVKGNEMIPLEVIEHRIFLIRVQKVMLDKDLAKLYGVQTRDLNKAVKRNLDRFPEDFMFQLTNDEFQSLMFHFGTSKRGGTRKIPYAFTEQGVAMLSGILQSQRAVLVNIAIMRAFVKLREILGTHKDMAHKLEELERRIGTHDRQIQSIYEAIRQLMVPPEKPKRPIGFRVEEPKANYRATRRK